ncbi:MAG: hypothetical protein JRF22_05690 [Deltaproteobacteria bacterium]|jgi:hypothetical protein|nr:hypothetical protein [Deltaproteobacteria bacterium]
MKFFRKSSLITILSLGIWLWTSFSFSMLAECSCYFQDECQCVCSEKIQAKQLSLKHRKHQENNCCHQENNHYYQEGDQCHQEDKQCSCTKCGKSDTKEAALKVYLTGKEKKQVLTPGQDILEREIPLPKNIVTYIEKKPTTKFLSLFLINSSFLL